MKNKTADEMFEDLGFEVFVKTQNITIYSTKDKVIVMVSFLYDKKEIRTTGAVDMKLLKVINKKIKELGWK